MKRIKLLFVLIVFLGVTLYGVQAQLTTPRPSNMTKINQRIGLTDITIKYSRPKVKGREIWGKLVPYGTTKAGFGTTKAMPWRAGANENTIVSFSTDVKIEGKELKAGTYGLHMIPGEEEWTVIFSDNYSSWGSFFYTEEEDALRVSVKPQSTHHHELLTYDVIDHSATGATIALSWEKLQVPVKVEMNTHDIVLASMRDELRGTAGFSWQGWNTAARYCVNNDINHEEALTWADRAINTGGGFSAMATKSLILAQTGEEEKADKMMVKAMRSAPNAQLNQYGYQLVNQGKLDKAIEAFKINVENNPDDPNVYDSLGEAYVMRGADGDKKLAIKNLEKSLSMDPPANVKQNSMKLLKQLGVKKYSDMAKKTN